MARYNKVKPKSFYLHCDNIKFPYQTLGVLSQDGLLRFIDIHACKQMFEIGGADEVWCRNDF